MSSQSANPVVDWLAAIAPLIAALSILFTGLWGLYTYRGQVRSQASKWAVDLYQGFYKDPLMGKARELVEYEYEEKLKFLLQKRVTNREVSLTENERRDLSRLDYFLNYLEQLRYLEARKVIRKADSAAFFAYWFEVLLHPDLSALRRYLARCGYEGLSEGYGLRSTEHVIFYGTLVGNSPRQDQLGLRGMLKRVGPITIVGQLFELPTCPGYLAEGNREYTAEVYEILDNRAFAILDEFEEYNPADPTLSRFIRQSVWVPELQIDAWLYTISPSALPQSATPISHSTWNQFVIATGKELPENPPPLTYLKEK